jgi:uncharacterized protein (TIGR00299 family) protein
MSQPSSTDSKRKRRASGARSEAKPSEESPTGKRRASGARSEAKPSEAERGRILHLDTFSGIAGNMFLAALLDLGLARRRLEEDLAGLGLEFKLKLSRVRRGSLAARYLAVKPPAARRPRGGASPGRSYLEIVRVLERARLEAPVRDRALAIFEALGRAEAGVHGTELAAVHFHELGAVDAIVDVTGAAIGLHRLGIRRVTATPVALGHGSLRSDHGLLPLPAPATLALLEGIPTTPAHVEWETVTPTGAAILRTVVDEFRQLPAMTIEAVGHGAGDDRPGPMPNLLRAVMGRDDGPDWDRIVSLETNLDDLVPEHFDYLMERLFETGALDVSIQHIQMKKNRPGFLVRVLARPADRIQLARILFAESTAIGVRTSEWDRLLLPREKRAVVTPYGRVGVKIVRGEKGRVEVSAEYDDCKRAARRAGVALREVVRVAEAAAREELD